MAVFGLEVLMKKWLLCALAFVSFAHADTINLCYQEASSYYHIPISLLYAITKVESDFKYYCINVNSNGQSIGNYCYNDYASAYEKAKELMDEGANIDVGLMQINSENIKDHGWSLRSVLDPCSNVLYGAYLLNRNIARYGYNWTAVWHYNGSPSYAYKVARALERFRALELPTQMTVAQSPSFGFVTVSSQ